MSQSSQRPLEVEVVISEVLRRGVYTSLGLIGLGTVLAFWQGDYGTAGGTTLDYERLIHGTHDFHRGAAWLLSGLLHLRGSAAIVCGLLLLIATPVIRVLISIVTFAVAKDRAYVAITSTVLVLLVLAFLLGGAG